MLVKRVNSSSSASQIVQPWGCFFFYGPPAGHRVMLRFPGLVREDATVYLVIPPDLRAANSLWGFLPSSLTSGFAVVCLGFMPLWDTWHHRFRGTSLQLIPSTRALYCQVAVRGRWLSEITRKPTCIYVLLVPWANGFFFFLFSFLRIECKRTRRWFMRYDIFMFSASNFHCDSCCFQTDIFVAAMRRKKMTGEYYLCIGGLQ